MCKYNPNEAVVLTGIKKYTSGLGTKLEPLLILIHWIIHCSKEAETRNAQSSTV